MNEGILLNPFYGDALGGDIGYETLRSTLTNTDVISMLNDYRALNMVPPNDFLSFLDASCGRGSQ